MREAFNIFYVAVEESVPIIANTKKLLVKIACSAIIGFKLNPVIPWIGLHAR